MYSTRSRALGPLWVRACISVLSCSYRYLCVGMASATLEPRSVFISLDHVVFANSVLLRLFVLVTLCPLCCLVGLDAVHSTSTSVLLQQRVTIPTSVFKELVSTQRERASASVMSPTAGTAPNAPFIEPVIVKVWNLSVCFPSLHYCMLPQDLGKRVGGSLDRMAGGSSSTAGSGLFGKPATTTYVNSVSVFICVNGDNDRVALVMTGRFLPDAKRDEFNGNVSIIHCATALFTLSVFVSFYRPYD